MTPKRQRNYKTITCQDCGGPAKAVNAQTRYCRSCALGRAAAWHDGRTARCSECGQKFIAWTGKSMTVCGACRHTPHVESVEGVCAWCEKDKVIWTEHMPICYPCLTHPKNASTVKNSITDKYRRMTNAE